MSQYYYFLVKKNLETNVYSIENGPTHLPQVFKHISGIDVLETTSPESLKDLSWSEIPEYGFWKAVFDEIPTHTNYQKVITKNIINETDQIVNINYSIQDFSPEEIKTNKDVFIEALTPTRDKYLYLTDFTQLSDAPISAEAKNDYILFRQQLRSLFNVDDVYSITWPTIPTSASNIKIPPFPSIKSLTGI